VLVARNGSLIWIPDYRRAIRGECQLRDILWALDLPNSLAWEPAAFDGKRIVVVRTNRECTVLKGEGILVINLITRTTLRTFGQEIPSFPATLQFYRLPNWDLLSAFGLGLTETSVWFVCKRTGQPLDQPRPIVTLDFQPPKPHSGPDGHD